MPNIARPFMTPAYPRKSWSTLYAPVRNGMWIRFTLHIPFPVDGESAPIPSVYVPFGRPQFVGFDERMSAYAGDLVCNGEAWLRHIRAQVTLLEIFQLSGTSPEAPEIWGKHHASEVVY